MATVADFARWMQQKISDDGMLYHRDAVQGIRDQFGEEFIYIKKSGNPAIYEDVLEEFRQLTEHSVVWEPGQLRWREAKPGDPRGLRQAD